MRESSPERAEASADAQGSACHVGSAVWVAEGTGSASEGGPAVPSSRKKPGRWLKGTVVGVSGGAAAASSSSRTLTVETEDGRTLAGVPESDCPLQNSRDDTLDDLVRADFLHEPGYAKSRFLFVLLLSRVPPSRASSVEAINFSPFFLLPLCLSLVLRSSAFRVFFPCLRGKALRDRESGMRIGGNGAKREREKERQRSGKGGRKKRRRKRRRSSSSCLPSKKTSQPPPQKKKKKKNISTPESSTPSASATSST